MNAEDTIMIDDTATNQVVLFTGGRDSTLTACILMLKNIPVYLLSADSGASLHRDVIHYRINELRNKFGNLVLGHETIDISGSFRKFALKDLEDDILLDKKI